MALYGSSVPIEGMSSGAMVVTVICPNTYSHQRLMQALLNIVPDAGEPHPSAYLAGFQQNEDGVIVPGCATGACGLD